MTDPELATLEAVHLAEAGKDIAVLQERVGRLERLVLSHMKWHFGMVLDVADLQKLREEFDGLAFEHQEGPDPFVFEDPPL